LTVCARFLRPFAWLAIAAVALAACSKGSTTGGSSSGGGSIEGLSTEVANYELLSGQPNRVLVGLFSKNGVLSYGTVSLSFSYLGSGQSSGSAATQPVGPTATGTFIQVPEDDAPVLTDAQMKAAAAKQPAITLPTTARGVYEANDVTFDKPGYWRVEVVADTANGTAKADASFPVTDKAIYPAVGDTATPSQNLTIKSDDGATLAAVDSRATKTSVPDPELHQWTVADALKQHRPIVIVVTTPLYCQSRFCGPITDEIGALQKQYGDRAVFIHLEVWRDFQKKVVNKAAAQWVYRGGDLTEPWVFLVGSDGKITDRWQNVLDRGQLEAELAKLPPMKSSPS
jgi:hypothetical protein